MIALLLLLLLLPAAPARAHDPIKVGVAPARVPTSLNVRWQPAAPLQGDAAFVVVTRLREPSAVEGSVGGRPLNFFPYGDGYAAIAGVDLETTPGTLRWRIGVVDGTTGPLKAAGTIRVNARKFPLQRLTLPQAMVELDPPTLARVEEEASRLRTLYATITPERLWRGRFTRPVAGTGDGTGFGARRIINGLRRNPHAGVDYSADAGTPVVAANGGKVALVGEMFFPGRLVVIDHGLGLFTLYFHLERVEVQEGELVERGQPIGTVGATGRATGPHLHFAAHVGQARIDPARLFNLSLPE
ncbi:MAG: M23 family metallopeptidase [candidate division NC10 bacterium]